MVNNETSSGDKTMNRNWTEKHMAELETAVATCPRCGSECPEIAVAIDGQCDACTGALYAEGAYDPFEDDELETDGEYDEDGNWIEDGDDWRDDDGQPDEYTEWQDLNGGDDWDHGQYDHYDEW